MEQHTHPLIRLYGQFGQLWVGLKTTQLSPADCRAQFQPIKEAAIDLIEDPELEPGDDLRIGYYRFLARSLRRLTFGKLSVFQPAEYWELADFMLARGEIIDDVLFPLTTDEGATRQDQLRWLELIDRSVALGESPACRLFFTGQASVQDGHINQVAAFKSAKDEVARQNVQCQRSQLVQGLQRIRERLLAAHPELAPRQADPPWESVRPLLLRSPPVQILLAPTVSGDRVFVVGCGERDSKLFIRLLSMTLSDDRPRTVGQAEVGPKDREWLYPHVYITGCCVADRQVYIATRFDGIYAFDLDGGAVHRIDRTAQLPSPAVESITMLNRKLYAGLGGGYLVAFTPGAEGCQVLASSRRKEKVSPLDDTEAFTVPYMIADPQRQRILFTSHWGQGKENPLTGLWELSVSTNTFVQRQRLRERAHCGSPIRDDHILVSSSLGWIFSFDLAENKSQLILATGDIGPGLEHKTALLRMYYRADPPHHYQDGWLWSSWPFSRISVAHAQQERFPPFVKGQDVFLGKYLEPIGAGDQLLVGDGYGIWLVKLRKEY